MSSMVGFNVVTAMLIVVYWVPTIAAVMAKPLPPHIGRIIAINLFLGWTLVGWVVALWMACRRQRSRG